MRLVEWRREQGRTQQQVADALGVNQSAVSQWERANDPYLPSPDVMRRIYALTQGTVAPNDFYDLPPLGQLQLAIETEAPLLDHNLVAERLHAEVDPAA